MSRIPRPLQADLVLHITTHALPDRLCFPDEESRLRFRQLTTRFSRLESCQIHAYALMDNHVHLLLTGQKEGASACLMHRLLGRHAQLQNRVEGRFGPRWHGRYSALVIENENHLLRSVLYIEANPWRAGLVEHPAQSTWTSYGANGLGRPEELITPHEILTRLGSPDEDWHTAYARLMDEYIRTAVRYKSPVHLPLTADPFVGLHVFQRDPGQI